MGVISVNSLAWIFERGAKERAATLAEAATSRFIASGKVISSAENLKSAWKMVSPALGKGALKGGMAGFALGAGTNLAQNGMDGNLDLRSSFSSGIRGAFRGAALGAAGNLAYEMGRPGGKWNAGAMVNKPKTVASRMDTPKGTGSRLLSTGPRSAFRDLLR